MPFQLQTNSVRQGYISVTHTCPSTTPAVLAAATFMVTSKSSWLTVPPSTICLILFPVNLWYYVKLVMQVISII